MKTKHFISAVDSVAIESAIGTAEAKTSGEIRVFVTRLKCADALPVARRHFDALGMQKTRDRNGVLIFVAPRSQTFAIVGDQAVHARCGDGFWAVLRDEMREHLKQGRLTEALVHAITRAGALLAEHFPPAGEKRNEQPDAVVQD
ncbi:MAG TPA: TPM domain-containing protein [Tepidisphaeraceae bacterium]|jgi:uncharacterized membrane protein|nr:TPM domain-containing protein [Tepidisphaeraceae bacterium]